MTTLSLGTRIWAEVTLSDLEWVHSWKLHDFRFWFVEVPRYWTNCAAKSEAQSRRAVKCFETCWNAWNRSKLSTDASGDQKHVTGMSQACRIILPSCSTANVCSLKVCQVWQRLRQAPLSCARLSHWRRETRMPRMPRMTDAQRGLPMLRTRHLFYFVLSRLLYPRLFRCHLNVTWQPHLCQSMSFVLDVFLISYAFFVFFLICVPLRFVFRRFRRWAVSFFVLLFLGSKVRTWGEIRRLLKSRPSRQIPGQASTVQFFSNRKIKQNSIIQIIQIIQSISKIFKVLTVCSSFWSL